MSTVAIDPPPKREPSARAPRPSPPREEPSCLRRLADLVRPYSLRLTFAVCMLIALAMVNMAMPAFIAVLLNDVFPNQNWTMLWWLLGGILAVYLARNVLYFGSKYTSVAVGEYVCFNLRNRLFEHLQRMTLRYYQQNKAGTISSRVMNDSYVVQSFIQDELPTLLLATFRFLALVCIIYAMHWKLALASTLVLPLHLIALRKFKRPIKHSSGAAAEQLAMVQGNLIEKFLGMEVVKSFTAEDRENAAFVRAIDRSRRSEQRSKVYHVVQKIVGDLLVGVGTIALLCYGAMQVMRPDNPMPAGTFIAFFGYVGMLYPTVLELTSGLSKLTRTSASVDRVFELLASENGERADDAHRYGPTLWPQVEGRIAYEGVSFDYGDGQRVLEDISFGVEPGEVCAIVGPSGSGKTTLANLLPRFIDPVSGVVKVDGADVREMDVRHLREAIGVAFQECFLFNSSIFENLRYARPDATIDEIIFVAKRTGAHDFIIRLPDGYSTVIGENGVSLSRGEKQRITLTRAMLKNPRILILDEATASLDTACESQIIPAILQFMEGKTTLMITHRPELLRHADKVVYLVDGRVAYQGPPSGEAFEAAGRAARPYKLPIAAARVRRAVAVALAGLVSATVVLGGAANDALAAEASDAVDDGVRIAGVCDRHARMVVSGDRINLRAGSALALKPGHSDAPDRLHGAGAVDADPGHQNGPASGGEGVSASMGVTTSVTGATSDAQDEQAADAAPADEPAAPQPPSGKFVPMPGLNAIQMHDLLDVAVAQLQAKLGYRTASDAQAKAVADAPEGLTRLDTLVNSAPANVRTLQIGFREFRSQPIHLWVYGEVGDEGEVAANPDVDAAEQAVNDAQDSADERTEALTIGDLAVETITLSFAEVDRCLAILKSLGYETIEFKDGGAGVGGSKLIEPSKPADATKLPIIMGMPATDATKLVGGATATGGSFGLTMTPSVANELPNHTSTAPVMKLVVMYDPAQPQQYANVLDRIRTTIDVPARQILIEAMVLEISETGLDQLGVQWELESPGGHLESLKVGRLPRFNTNNNEVPTVDATFSDIFGEFRVKIQALVREGHAEVLSRPSVLTIDNRQASIRVGEEIPVATSASGLQGGDKLSFDFKYIPVGILLNTRPRVDADGEMVSMQIDGIVSDEVPGQDLVVRDSQGNEVVRAPRISTRRVQTYSRIANNTPFIIGGLVSKEEASQVDKVPLLGDIPLLGELFKQTRTDTLKREVIIVLTPYVLPEPQLVGRTLPKDVDAFDNFGHELFRDAYRIRAEDVFDLAFLRENPNLRNARAFVNELLRKDPRLGSQYPFNVFAGRRIPGEEILVYRQMYEVIKRKELDATMRADKMIFFRPDPGSESGFRVQFLQPFINEMTGFQDARRADDLAAAFAQLGGKAIALTYTVRHEDMNAAAAFEQPVPDIRLVECPDEATFSSLLWELNQEDELGRNRHTILLRGVQDLTRLKRAALLKRTVLINANEKSLTLENFSIGRLLLMPTVKEEQVYLIDEETAKYFYLTELYYPALRQEIAGAAAALREAAEDPRVKRHMDAP